MVKPIINVEVQAPPDCDLEAVEKYLRDSYQYLPTNSLLSNDWGDELEVESIRISESTISCPLLSESSLEFHVFQFSDDSDIESLPNEANEGMWENLIYDSEVKQNLLDYIQTGMNFSDKGVDCNIIPISRVILFHGPPGNLALLGTGKTSLCKALAHKISIRLGSRYPHARLVSLDAGSLFSKYFAESSKKVTNLFQNLREFASHSDSLLILLMDEVESITACRQNLGSEPSDSIRVVNTVLTQVDELRSLPNVLILATTNLSTSIDVAFLDRADLKIKIDYPSKQAIYSILAIVIMELVRCQIIIAEPNFAFQEYNSTLNEPSLRLKKACVELEGYSGRKLAKVPFLIFANIICKKEATLVVFLDALDLFIRKK